jgi:hypothetical protein
MHRAANTGEPLLTDKGSLTKRSLLILSGIVGIDCEIQHFISLRPVTIVIFVIFSNAEDLSKCHGLNGPNRTWHQMAKIGAPART